jgi:integrase
LPPIKKDGPHVFRETAITNRVRHGVTLADAQYATGHQSDQTTKEYYVEVLCSRAVESVRAAIS